jgi:hypothetical protein
MAYLTVSEVVLEVRVADGLVVAFVDVVLQGFVDWQEVTMEVLDTSAN